MISRIEYGDTTEAYVTNLAQICEHSVFQWREAVLYYESVALKQKLDEEEDLFRGVGKEKTEQAEVALKELYQRFLENTTVMPADKKQLQLLSITLQGIAIWNETGLLAKNREETGAFDPDRGRELAGKLENWFMAYKEVWRMTSKEGDLHHVAEIVFWYADWMRGRFSEQ